VDDIFRSDRAPDYPYSYKNCAMAYIETNRLHKAAEYLEKYLELSPDDIYAAKLLRDVNDVLEVNIRR
jgi:tetratricopeptide (TPR) repeat protein